MHQVDDSLEESELILGRADVSMDHALRWLGLQRGGDHQFRGVASVEAEQAGLCADAVTGERGHAGLDGVGYRFGVPRARHAVRVQNDDRTRGVSCCAFRSSTYGLDRPWSRITSAAAPFGRAEGLSRFRVSLARSWSAGLAFHPLAGPDSNVTVQVETSHDKMGFVSDMNVEFAGPVVEWRGPAPFFFVAIPKEVSADIKVAARAVEYWGQVPVVVRISDTTFTTALFPKDGRYSCR